MMVGDREIDREREVMVHVMIESRLNAWYNYDMVWVVDGIADNVYLTLFLFVPFHLSIEINLI